MSINTISPTHSYKGTIPELAKDGELLEGNRSEKITVDYYSDCPSWQNPYEYHSMTLNLGNKLRLKERDFQIVTATMYDGSTAYIDGSNAPYENRIYGFYDQNQGQRRMKEYTIERFDEGGGLVFSKTFYEQNVPICQDVDELNESVCANLAEGVNVIRDKTFYGTVLKPNKKPWEKAAIVIPEGVESIERLVIGKWRYVSSLVLPDSLKVWPYAIDEVRGHLGRGALNEFNGCLYIGTATNPYFACVGVKKSAGETYDAEENKLATGSFEQPYNLSLDEDLHLYNDALYLDLSETTAMTLLQMMGAGSPTDTTMTHFVTPSFGYTENLGINELIAANLSSIVETLTGLASLNQLVTIVEDDGFYEWTANIPGELLLGLFIETSTQVSASEGATAEELEAIRQVYEKALEGTEIGTLGLQLDYNEEGYFELTLNPWTVDILFNSGNYPMTDAHVNFDDFALNLIVRAGIEVDDSWKPAEDSNYVPLFGESGTVEA